MKGGGGRKIEAGQALGAPRMPCLLCGSKAVVRGLFLPQDSQFWGAACGKQRVFVYDLCALCSSREDTPRRVEEDLMAGLCEGGEAS